MLQDAAPEIEVRCETLRAVTGVFFLPFKGSAEFGKIDDGCCLWNYWREFELSEVMKEVSTENRERYFGRSWSSCGATAFVQRSGDLCGVSSLAKGAHQSSYMGGCGEETPDCQLMVLYKKHNLDDTRFDALVHDDMVL